MKDASCFQQPNTWAIIIYSWYVQGCWQSSEIYQRNTGRNFLFMSTRLVLLFQVKRSKVKEVRSAYCCRSLYRSDEGCKNSTYVCTFLQDLDMHASIFNLWVKRSKIKVIKPHKYTKLGCNDCIDSNVGYSNSKLSYRRCVWGHWNKFEEAGKFCGSRLYYYLALSQK